MAGLTGFSAFSPTIAAAQTGSQTESKAVSFLVREVPLWPSENHCFSCHNNGDATRALLRAQALGIALQGDPLKSTVDWLGRPEAWDRNGGDGPFNDRKLAKIVFSATLSAAIASGEVRDRATLERVAEWVAAVQTSDGTWKLDGENQVGSPASYGPGLATVMARDTLRAANPLRFRPAIERANRWIVSRKPRTIDDAAVGLWGRSDSMLDRGGTFRAQCIDLIQRGQNVDGGWGPFSVSASENFDTSLVLLALMKDGSANSANTAMIRKGRAYLITSQSEEGCWKETTRPSGGESYAQRISTTGWALLALLETRAIDRPQKPLNEPRP